MKSVMIKVLSGYAWRFYEHYMFSLHSVTRSQRSNHYIEANNYAHTHTHTHTEQRSVVYKINSSKQADSRQSAVVVQLQQAAAVAAAVGWPALGSSWMAAAA